MKIHETWWQRNLPDPQNMNMEKMGRTFRNWLKDADCESRKVFRDIIAQHGYKTMLDCAAGLCIEYDGIFDHNVKIEYTAIDITPKLVDYNKNRGINIILGSIENIPYPNDFFELCYGRHILEHLQTYKLALAEMLRVASKAVVITFFRPPQQNESIEYMEDEKLYHNFYSKPEIETAISNFNYEWIKPKTKEIILHIKL